MNIIQKIISVIAPHQCVGCGHEGSLICKWCFYEHQPEIAERCIECNAVAADARTCESCKTRRHLPRNVWAVSDYDGVVKELLLKLKFGNASVAADTLGDYMDGALPHLPLNTVIVHIPTSSKRARVRGYDQAELIARRLAVSRNLTTVTLLDRLTHSQQVGSARADRLSQLENAFEVLPNDIVTKQTPILLVDDIYTTGGTLGSATEALRREGYRNIYAAVCARAQ